MSFTKELQDMVSSAKQPCPPVVEAGARGQGLGEEGGEGRGGQERSVTTIVVQGAVAAALWVAERNQCPPFLPSVHGRRRSGAAGGRAARRGRR